jgi:hypothetical protein
MKSNKTAKAFAWFSALLVLFGVALFFAADTLATPWMSYASSPRPVPDTVATIHHVSATLIVIGAVLAAVAFSTRTRSPRPTQQQ